MGKGRTYPTSKQPRDEGKYNCCEKGYDGNNKSPGHEFMQLGQMGMRDENHHKIKEHGNKQIGNGRKCIAIIVY